MILLPGLEMMFAVGIYEAVKKAHTCAMARSHGGSEQSKVSRMNTAAT
jgi:hypothetical protein